MPVDWTQFQSPDWPASKNWGSALATADLNDDGFDDLVVGEPGATVAGKLNAGSIWILFGPLPMGSKMHLMSTDPVAGEFLGEADLPHLGSSAVAIGDPNGDGHLDLLVGGANYRTPSPLTPDVGRAHLFFGPNFDREAVFYDPTPQANGYFGKAVLLADVTGDDVDDVLVGAPYSDGFGPGHLPMSDVGEVWLWKSESALQTPELLHNPVPVASALFGWSLDVVAVDATEPNRLMVGTIGHNIVCCPTSWGVIHSFAIPNLQYNGMITPPPLPSGAAISFGDVVHCGDLTGDSIDDLVVSAWTSFIGCQIAGGVMILEGPAFTSTKVVLTSPNACKSGFSGYFGLETVVSDFDRDGSVDIIVGDSGQAWGDERAFIYYGPTFGSAQELGNDLDFVTVGFGAELAIGDYDDDGWDECAIFAPEGGGTGSVYLYDVQTLIADKATISTSAGSTVGFTMEAGSAYSSGLYLAALSISGSTPGLIPGPGVYLPLNVDAITFIGLSLVTTPLLPGFVGILDTDGHAAFSLVLPAGSAGGLIGETLTVACVIATTGGKLVAGSSRVELSVEP